jgi:chitinase
MKNLFCSLILMVILSFSFAQSAEHQLIGYWHGWNDVQAPFMQLDQVDNRYDVICVAFAMPVSPSDMQMTLAVDGMNEQQITSQIASLQSQGKKVLLSIGGATSYIMLQNITDKQNFVSSLLYLLNTYGFDGLDIDIESGNCILISGGTIANPSSQGQIYFIEAIREIMQVYRAVHGTKMMLTAAPETAYIQGGMSGFASIWGGYLPVIDALRDSLDILQVQLYNSGTMYGIDGNIYSVGTVDFVIALTEAVIQGFNTSGGFFMGLPACKIAVGLPACNSAAGSGYITPDSLIAAMRYLTGEGTQPGNYTLVQSGGYPSLRGMMTWSINWDAAPACNGSYTYASVYESVFGNDPCLNDQNDILSFIIPNQISNQINNTNKTVVITMPVGTDITQLIPTITVSPSATIIPNSGVVQDFSYPVTYTVTAENGTAQNWTVTIQAVNKITVEHNNYCILYPNPVDDKVIINMNSRCNTIEVTNLLGQTVYKTNIVDTQIELNTISYNAGIYYVKIQNDTGIIIKKFIKK